MASIADGEANLPEGFEAMFDQLQESAGARAVFGEAVERGDRTVIPVARVAYGFGGGWGGPPGGASEGGGEGAGGGGGAMARPVGALEITDRETRFVSLPTARSRMLAAGAFLVGLLLGRVLARRGAA